MFFFPLIIKINEHILVRTNTHQMLKFILNTRWFMLTSKIRCEKGLHYLAILLSTLVFTKANANKDFWKLATCDNLTILTGLEPTSASFREKFFKMQYFHTLN